jgi:hypothetical protein
MTTNYDNTLCRFRAEVESVLNWADNSHDIWSRCELFGLQLNAITVALAKLKDMSEGEITPSAFPFHEGTEAPTPAPVDMNTQTIAEMAEEEKRLFPERYAQPPNPAPVTDISALITGYEGTAFMSKENETWSRVVLRYRSQVEAEAAFDCITSIIDRGLALPAAPTRGK